MLVAQGGNESISEPYRVLTSSPGHSQFFNVSFSVCDIEKLGVAWGRRGLTGHIIYKGSLHTSQISHLLLYPSLWLLVPGLSSHYFLYNLLLTSAVVGNIFEKWLQDFVSFRNPCYTDYSAVTYGILMHYQAANSLTAYTFGLMCTCLVSVTPLLQKTPVNSCL